MRHDGGPHQDAPRRRSLRRRVVPSALVHDPAFVGAFDGYAILQEVPEGHSAFALFQIYRSVMLWARTEPEDRAGLFGPDLHEHVLASAYVGLPQQLDGVLAACAVFGPDSPGAGARVLAGCMALGEATARQGWLATALALHIAAACVDPDGPGAALAVGQIAMRAGRSAVAEMWLRRSLVLGRRTSEWDVASRAYLELAGLALRDGRRRRAPARRLLTLAFRAARRHRVREVAAEAADQLHRLAREAGEYEAADAYARRAIRAYAPGPARTAMRESLAAIRLAQGAAGDAVALLEAVLAASPDNPRDRARTLTTMVAALGMVPHPPLQSLRIRRCAEEAAALVADDAPRDRAAAVRALLALASAVAPADKPMADGLRRQALGLARHTEDAALVAEVRTRLAPAEQDRRAGAA